MSVRPASFWQAEGQGVRCLLCPHECLLDEGQVGECGVRCASHGELCTAADGQLIAAHVTSIESKPFYHLAPGREVLSFGVPGCTMRCPHCQNWQVSQAPKAGGGPPTLPWQPDELVAAASAAGCVGLAATFTEPTLSAEFCLRVGPLAKDAGLWLLWKTNGFSNSGVIDALAPWLRGVNVDLKAWDERWWRRLRARREPVLAAIRQYAAAGLHLELTSVLSPSQWAAPDEFGNLSKWILDELGPDVPWHLQRYHPDYRADDGRPTASAILLAARRRALDAGHRYVYTDAAPEGRATHCPSCGRVVVDRTASGRPSAEPVATACQCGQRWPVVLAQPAR